MMTGQQEENKVLLLKLLFFVNSEAEAYKYLGGGAGDIKQIGGSGFDAKPIDRFIDAKMPLKGVDEIGKAKIKEIEGHDDESPLRIVPTDPKAKKKNKKTDTVVVTPSDTTLSHSDTTTAGNPVTPGMIDLLSRQGMTKEEINVLHKHNEPGRPYGRTGKIEKK